MNRVVLATSLLVSSAAAAASPQQEIAAVLDKSAVDWSRGDLAAFMRSYEDSPATEYIAPSGPVRGYAAIAERYRRKYGAAGSTFGQLGFADLDIRLLDPVYALTTGRFVLRRPPGAGGDATGIFTLILHKGGAGWRIVYDHTS